MCIRDRGLLYVIEELRKEDTAISRNIADHIDSFADYDFAHLLFSDGTVENAISLDNQLNIIQVADLVPVSYTHLAVYKRQVVDNASDENNENTRRKATVVPIKIEYV